jgi:hypothetical protein
MYCQAFIRHLFIYLSTSLECYNQIELFTLLYDFNKEKLIQNLQNGIGNAEEG